MNYSTEQIIAIKTEAEAVVAELKAQAAAVKDDADKSGLQGTAGQEMQRVVTALTNNVAEAEKLAQDVATMADEKVTSQQASDSKVSGYING